MLWQHNMAVEVEWDRLSCRTLWRIMCVMVWCGVVWWCVQQLEGKRFVQLPLWRPVPTGSCTKRCYWPSVLGHGTCRPIGSQFTYLYSKLLRLCLQWRVWLCWNICWLEACSAGRVVKHFQLEHCDRDTSQSCLSDSSHTTLILYPLQIEKDASW